MLPTEQAIELAKEAVNAPINNLIAVVAIGALGILALAIFVFWKSSGFLARFFSVMTENIQKLTTLEQQNSEQSKRMLEGLAHNTTEMTKQTTVIEGLSRDTRSYQTLVSDTLSGVGDEVKNSTKRTIANTEAIARLAESVETNNSEIRKSIDELTEQIKRLSEKDECTDLVIKWAQLKDELIAAMQQPTPAVATHTVTVDVAPPELKNVA